MGFFIWWITLPFHYGKALRVYWLDKSVHDALLDGGMDWKTEQGPIQRALWKLIRYYGAGE